MKQREADLEAEVGRLRSAVVSLSEATDRALCLIEIAHRRDLAQDLGYQDLISEAHHYASRAKNQLDEGARKDVAERPRETLKPHKYL